MIKMLAVKTDLGYYKNGDPFLMVDFHRASVFPLEQADVVHNIMKTLTVMGLENHLVEMTIALTEWQDVASWQNGHG